MIAERLPTPHDILNFTLIHPHLCRIGEEQLYAHLDYQNQHSNGRRRYQQLTDNLYKRHYIRRFTRSLTIGCWVDVIPSQTGRTITLSTHLRCLNLTRMFINLKTLNIAIPHGSTFFSESRPDINLPRLEYLHVTPLSSEVQSNKPPIMQLTFLHWVLQLRRLKTIDLSVFIPDSQKLLMSDGLSSSNLVYGDSLEELHLSVGQLDSDTLKYLVDKLPHMKVFSLRPKPIPESSYQGPIYTGHSVMGSARSILIPSTLGHLLAKRSSTLQHLDVQHASGWWDHWLDRIGTLEYFSLVTQSLYTNRHAPWLESLRTHVRSEYQASSSSWTISITTTKELADT